MSGFSNGQGMDKTGTGWAQPVQRDDQPRWRPMAPWNPPAPARKSNVPDSSPAVAASFGQHAQFGASFGQPLVDRHASAVIGRNDVERDEWAAERDTLRRADGDLRQECDRLRLALSASDALKKRMEDEWDGMRLRAESAEYAAFIAKKTLEESLFPTQMLRDLLSEKTQEVAQLQHYKESMSKCRCELLTAENENLSKSLEEMKNQLQHLYQQHILLVTEQVKERAANRELEQLPRQSQDELPREPRRELFATSVQPHRELFAASTVASFAGSNSCCRCPLCATRR